MLTALLVGLAVQVSTVMTCAVWLKRRLRRHFDESADEFWRYSATLLDSTAARIAEALAEGLDGPPESERHLASVSDIPPR